MAIWNYRYYLIPLASVVDCNIINTSNVLTEYKKNNFNNFDENKEFKNYFEQHNQILTFISEEASKIFTVKEAWDEDAIIFYDEYGNTITIWSDDIMCELDLRFNCINFIKQTINWAVKYQCVIVIEETGKVINPDINNFIEIIINSNVNNIFNNPLAFIKNSCSSRRYD